MLEGYGKVEKKSVGKLDKGAIVPRFMVWTLRWDAGSEKRVSEGLFLGVFGFSFFSGGKWCMGLRSVMIM